MAESRLRPSYGALLGDGRLLFVVTAVACLLASLGPLAAYDVWWHIKAGQMIAATGQIPYTDVYSFTAAGRPWTDHSWLAGLVLAGVWALGRTAGLALFNSVMMTCSLMLGWILARRRGVNAALASLFVLAACLQLRVDETARPYLFSYVLFMVFAHLLQSAFSSVPPEDGEGKARYWLWGRGGRLALLVPLTLLWANLHAGFLVGIILLGAYGAGELVRLAMAAGGRPYLRLLLRECAGARFRAMFGVGVASLLASLVTPYGPGVLTYTFRLLGTVKYVRKIEEWKPTEFTSDYVVFWGVLAIGTVVLARSVYGFVRSGGPSHGEPSHGGPSHGGLRRALRRADEAGQIAVDVLLFAGFGLMAARGVRHIAWVMLPAAAIVGSHFAPAPRLAETAGRKLIYGGAALALAVVVAATPFTGQHVAPFGVDQECVPVKACKFVKHHGLTSYRVFNSYGWGGYLIFRFWPQMHVFIDGRADLYGDEIIGLYLQVIRPEGGWQNVLARYDVQMLFLDCLNSRTNQFFDDHRWRCVYWDDVALVALRDDVLAAQQPGLKEFPLSNPGVFERSLTEAPTADIMAELDAVLARDPKCWTALSYRARCLVRLASQSKLRNADCLRQAAEAVQQAMALEDERPAPWLAAADVARAQGSDALADKDVAKAHKYAKRRT